MALLRSKQLRDFKKVVDWNDINNDQIPNSLDVFTRINSQILLNKPTYHTSENLNTVLTTSSSSDTTLMSLTPTSVGIYSITFNSQYILDSTDITTQAYIDLNLAYQDLMSYSVTSNIAAAIPTSTFTPGVYSMAAAGTIAANLVITLNGLGLYVFKAGAAFSMGAGVKIILTGGALASDVFWVAEGAIALGAGANVSGNLISNNGAVSLAAGCSVKGRLLAVASGAIAINSSTLESLNQSTIVSLGVLSSFSIFTTGGTISNTSTSIIYGNIGTRTGTIATATFASPTIFYGQYYTQTIHSSEATFSIYVNGTILPNSSRSRHSDSYENDVSLAAIDEVLLNGSVDIKWNVDSGNIKSGRRVLTLIKLN